MDIVLDFDGTCVAHEYPKIGKDIGAQTVLRQLISNGHNLILFTMRSGKHLRDAEDWFKHNNLNLFGSQTNPTQSAWTSSPKAYGHIYIDDLALGAPLVYEKGFKPYINWSEVEKVLQERGLISLRLNI